jgi:hypothetical protein
MRKCETSCEFHGCLAFHCAKLTRLDNHAIRITSDFYGFALPWIIHASAQQARTIGQENIANEPDVIAALVELGVPNETATRVFLAGVR